MPTQVQFRRGTAAQNDNFTGAVGEISINTSNNTIRVHDGSTAGGFELSRKADLTTANVTELTNLYFTTQRAIDALNSNTVSIGDLTVTGNLLVQGSTTEISTTSLVVEDKNIVLADGAASAAAADGAGITIDGASATFTYTNSNDSWSLNKSLTLSGNIIPLSDNTYDLGSATNRFKDLYLTGNSLILGNVTLKEEGGGLQVVNSDTDEVVFTASNASGVTSVAGAIGDVTNVQLLAGIVQAQIDTDDVLESAGNLYFTQARARESLSQSSGITYNQSSGVIAANVVTVAGQVGEISNSQLLSAIISVGGSGSNLNADLLDGLQGGGNGAYALKANNLSVFASTTSAELAGVISDETGSGSLVFATSPTLDGTPQAPTAAIGTANTMIATTEFASNASYLASGIVNPSRIAGSYTGITGLGTITTGVWQGSSISTTYTDAKVVSVNGEAGTVVLTTANINEQTNLYYTNERVYANIVTTYGAAANTYVNARLLTKANVSDLTTSNVTEGTNLYFTNTRARDSITAGTGVSYNAGTGTISIGQSVGTNDSVTFSNVTVTGNLLVQGDSIQFTSNNLLIEDPLFQVGINPVDDTVDLGFFGHYNDGTVERHAGLFRDATDGQFKLFSNLITEPDTIVATGDSSYRNANIVVNFVVGKVTDISNHSTTNLAEGTNQYFTQARARESLSQGSGITYNQSTGVISANVTSVAGQTGAISNNQLLSAILAVDGVGSTLDADLLDGLAGGGAGAYALKANNLSVFASTTSAQLAGVISDETGSGSLVFATSPTLAGTPQVPTAAASTSNNMIASTAFAADASNLTSGTVPAARISGSYTGITGVGTISSGTWQGSSISTTYTDAKITSVAGQTGAISNNQLLAAVSAVDGVGSGLDADVLDGLAGGGAGFYALKANNLSVFASTTSAQLAGVISDETGSGNLVFNASPTFTGTPLAPTAAIGTANTMIATTAFASNASALASGVINPARVVGSYTSITGVGTIAAGTWQGSSISTTYTDAKLTSVAATSPIATSGATGSITLSHVNSGVAAATYGNATIIPVITVNATGHVTSVANVAVAATGGGGGGGDFNTAIAGAAAANVTTVLTSFFTAPAVSGKRYVVRSVQVTNVSGSSADITADFSGSTYSSIAFAHTVPVPSGSSVDLLKRPKVMQPSDALRLQASANSALQAVITYETVNEAKHFGAGIDLTSSATLTTLHTATANSVIESILLSNDDGGLDVKARVAWTNASDTVLAYLAYDLIVPADATVEVIDAPKFLENGFKIRVEANQANRLEAIIAGKTV